MRSIPPRSGGLRCGPFGPEDPILRAKPRRATRVGTLEHRGSTFYIQSSPYFDPTHTRTGWIGQPPILNRHEVVTIDGDVDTLGQATP